MRVYLAGPYAARDQLRTHAIDLAADGHECMSTWLTEAHEISAGTTGAATALSGEQVDAHARQDLLDITLADALVLFTASAVGMDAGSAGSGGRHVETGFALARGVPVIVVGEPENVFHRLASGVTQAGHWPDALRLLGQIGGPR